MENNTKTEKASTKEKIFFITFISAVCCAAFAFFYYLLHQCVQLNIDTLSGEKPKVCSHRMTRIDDNYHIGTYMGSRHQKLINYGDYEEAREWLIKEKVRRNNTSIEEATVDVQTRLREAHSYYTKK